MLTHMSIFSTSSSSTAAADCRCSRVMLPLLTLPTLIDDPGRVFAGQALAPIFQGGQVGQLLQLRRCQAPFLP